MSGRVEFFADGPFAGWHEVEGRQLICRLDRIDMDAAAYTPGVHPKALKTREVVYTRRRWIGAGWLTPIPIWTSSSQLAPGTVIPGVVVGAKLPQWPIEWRQMVLSFTDGYERADDQ